MSSPLRSLIATGTKLWLDSVDPSLIPSAIEQGATGATSNPIIIAEIVKKGGIDGIIRGLQAQKLSPEDLAWAITDTLVGDAEKAFLPIFRATKAEDGYVSFELDPLIEDQALNLSHTERVSAYVRLGKKWSSGHPNRLIKVPATPAGLEALEELAAAGVNLNITLIFSQEQYLEARRQVCSGLRRRREQHSLKSVYSIFVSRLDVYAQQKYPHLSPEALGQVGLLNAKRIWRLNQEYWKTEPTRLKQEMVFASTGTKKLGEEPWRYVAALAGSDIETNPPATNDATLKAPGLKFNAQIDKLPSESIVRELDQSLNWSQMAADLMADGLSKFADPHKALIRLLAEFPA